MICEQELSFETKPENILKEFFEKYEYKDSNIIIKYYGNKSQIPLNDQRKWNTQDEEEKNQLKANDPRN